MDHEATRSEKGQNIILVAILMLVFIGLLALVLDGGMAFAKRREAQNAADAGALAGANQLCNNPGVEGQAAAQDAALNYAIIRNHAVKADVQVSENVINVTAFMNNRSFFAQMLGTNIITETATASAGCYSPCAGSGIMPVAWACHDPISSDTSNDSSCGIQYGTETEAGPTYIIMDSSKAAADYQCLEPGQPPTAGYIDCNPDGDEENEYITGGGRSWVDLNGYGGGSSELVCWIKGIETLCPVSLSIHTWLPEQSGVATDVFKAAETRVGQIVILPVFNKYTPGCNPQTDPGDLCIGQWETGQDSIMTSSSTAISYYHIISYSLFKITCVTAPGGNCPGKSYLISYNIIDNNTKTIEGYFVEGHVNGLSGKCNYDAGAHTIYLSH